jgi:hypothetical protein
MDVVDTGRHMLSHFMTLALDTHWHALLAISLIFPLNPPISIIPGQYKTMMHLHGLARRTR